MQKEVKDKEEEKALYFKKQQPHKKNFKNQTKFNSIEDNRVLFVAPVVDLTILQNFAPNFRGCSNAVVNHHLMQVRLCNKMMSQPKL